MIRFDKGRSKGAAPAMITATLLFGVGMASTHPALAQGNPAKGGKTDTALAQVLRTVRPDSRGWTSVILQRTPGTTSGQVEKAVADLGGDVFRHLNIIQSIAVRVPTRNLQKLAELACVSHLSADVQTRKSDDFTVKHTGADVAAASPSSGGYGLSGASVTVAVLDSGIRGSNKDLKSLSGKSRIAGSINFVPDSKGKVKDNDSDDQLGHGTHVAGIIAGNGSFLNRPAVLSHLHGRCALGFPGQRPRAG